MKSKKAILALGILVTAFLLLQWPMTTRQGINWQVSEIKIPLYLKTLLFLSRNYEMKFYTQQILQDEKEDVAKIKKLYEWTTLHIHPTPQGFEVIDDHPLHIFIRRYGAGDQMADLFSLLCTYAGLSAFYRDFKVNGAAYSLAFIKHKNSWYAFDLSKGIEFIKEDQTWATLPNIQNNDFLLKTFKKNKPLPSKKDYHSILKDFDPEKALSTRNLKQMPLSRLKFFIGLKP